MAAALHDSLPGTDEAKARVNFGRYADMVDWAIAFGLVKDVFRVEFRRHVDFSTGLITIPRSKSGELRRVTMNDTVREILRSRPSRLKGEYVFPSSTGDTPIDAQNYVNRVFNPALKTAKVESFTWHCLRHTFASRLVMAGVDLRTVQELMGHKTQAMTLCYSHLSPEHQLDAVQRLNAKPTDTTTGTEENATKTAVAASAEVVELPQKESGDAWNRTTDLGIMSGVKDGPEPQD